MHTPIISSSISVVNDKVVVLGVCMSAVTEANNSIDEFNIETMELVIRCRGREVGDEPVAWAIRLMAESVNLIPLNGMNFMTAHEISTTLLSMTTMMMTALVGLLRQTAI